AYDDPDRLVAVWGTSEIVGQQRDVISGPNFLDVKERNTTFQIMAAYKSEGGTLLIDDAPVPTNGILVSPDFFSVLGTRPILGRLFRPEDGHGQTNVAVSSHRLWQQMFGGDPTIVGRQIQQIGPSLAVIGVLPETFPFVFTADLVVPMDLDNIARQSRTSINYWILGRLRPDVTVAQAQSDLNVLLREIARDDRRMEPWSITVDPLQAALIEYVRLPLLIMLVTVALAFLIACANVANLLLARGLARSRELAIRASLGAGRGRLVAQLLTEASLLAVGGGAIGLFVGLGFISIMQSFLPTQVPVPGSAAVVALPAISASPTVMVFAFGISALAVCLFGLVPALQTSRQEPGVVLREAGTNASAGRSFGRAQQSIIVLELAMATVLLTTTGVAIRSTMRLLDVDPGVDPNPVLTMYIGDLDPLGSDDRARYYTQVLDAVAAVPGVASVGINDYVPFQQEDDFEGLHLEGRPRPDPSWRVEWRRVSADYFRTVNLALRRGRQFTAADNNESASVVIINEAMAKKYWPTENPLGQRIVVHEGRYGSSVIIGIVGDVRRRGLDQAAPPVMYVPYHRRPRPVVGLFVQAEGEPMALASAVKAAVWSVDPHQPIEEVRSLGDIVTASTAIQRLVLRLVALVAGLAVVLATIGVYGVMSYWIVHRTKEMSIRMALGARHPDVLHMVFRAGLKMALLGLPLGLGFAALLTQVVSTQLYGVETGDPVPYLMAGLVVVSVALAACLLPARRASRIDPIHALRVE
ncbi:MAG: ABC transporter permease, partial [Planctomycetota bacterium]|nr:ABC transporter permease [Planctomycetota bacterium]